MPVRSMRTSRLERPVQSMASFVRVALLSQGQLKANRERPAYQRNDYLSWIQRAKMAETRQKRLPNARRTQAWGSLYEHGLPAEGEGSLGGAPPQGQMAASRADRSEGNLLHAYAPAGYNALGGRFLARRPRAVASRGDSGGLLVGSAPCDPDRRTPFSRPTPRLTQSHIFPYRPARRPIPRTSGGVHLLYERCSFRSRPDGARRDDREPRGGDRQTLVGAQRRHL